MKKVAIISLGCAKNLVDSENILGLLIKNHYQIVSSKDEADILIINTCGFIEASKKESIDVILDNINGKQKVVVTGCLVNRYVDELKKEIPEVDLWIPIRDYPRFNALLKTLDQDITNYEGLNDIRRGVIIWFIDHDKVIYAPISEITKMKKDGLKSINVKTLKEYNMVELDSIKKRVFLETDYSKLLEVGD